MSRPRVLLSWSSGKDSAWTLHTLNRDPRVDVVGLLTSFNESADRVAMHAVRRELVDLQAAAAGLPLHSVDLPWPCTNDSYEQRMGAAFRQARADGVTHIAFGDLFLDDVRDYRIRQLEDTGLEPLFPLWGSDTRLLARSMVEAGVRAILTCIDPQQLDRSFIGRTFDAGLLDDLPDGTDPCAERGEFHTCCVAGPMFSGEIDVEVGDIVTRDGFVFADLTAREKTA